MTRVAVRRGALVYGQDLSPERCMVVGDTPHDADAAHDAGIACVGVASHNFTAAQLRQGGADWVIDPLGNGFPEGVLT